VLISHSFNLGLSVFCAVLTMNNFLYDQNLTKTFLDLILRTLMYRFMKKIDFFENSRPRKSLNIYTKPNEYFLKIHLIYFYFRVLGVIFILEFLNY